MAGTAWDETVDFGYNAAGQITSRTSSNDGYVIGRPHDEQNEAVNGLNQLTQVSTPSTAQAVVHDTRGNLAEWGGRSFRYSDENRLTYVSGTPGTGRLDYDPVGRLDRNGASGTSFQYAGDELVAEWNEGGAQIRRYVHGAGTDEPLVWYEGSGTGDRRWLHADERGSIAAVTRGDGEVIQINRYDEYGAPASSNSGRFGYTGQTLIEHAGLWHYKARAYAPGIGRFMQTDPIGYGDGPNMYAYVGGDPVNMVDPSGLCKNSAACTEQVIVTGMRLYGSTGTGAGGTLALYYAVRESYAEPYSYRGLASGGATHYYPVDSRIAPANCRLSPAQVRDIAARFAFIGQDENKPVVDGGRYTADGSFGLGIFTGPIEINILERSAGTVARTLPGHPLHRGYLSRTWSTGPNGFGLNVASTGGGKGSPFWQGMNQLFGPNLVRDLDARAASYVRSRYCR